MKRTAAILGLATVALGAAACGPNVQQTAAKGDGAKSSVVADSKPSVSPKQSATTAEKQSARQNVSIVSKGFTQLAPDSIGSSYVSYGVILKNPNASHWIADDVEVNITFYNAAGTVVKSESDTVNVLLPGQTAAVGDDAEATGATRMEVQALVSDWEASDTETGAFAATGVSVQQQSFGELQVNGTLSSTFAKDLKDVHATAIFYNAQGAIVGGAFTYVDFVPAGGKVGVEVSSMNDVPGVTKAEIYTSLSSLSLFED